MENYKIKRNPKPLSDEQINRHKDFGKLLSNQQKLHRYKDGTKPLYKNPGFLGMMVVVGAVLLMLVLDRPEKDGQEILKDTVGIAKADTGLQIPVGQDIEVSSGVVTDTVSQQKMVSKKSNISADLISYEDFKVDPAKGAVLYTSSGIRMLVPSFAFSERINEEVTLKYREINSLKKAGISREPAFAPVKSFEVLAQLSATGRTVALSKPIVLELVTSLQQTSGMIHCYQKEKNEWQASGKETYVYRFTIQANDSQFPELSLLTGLAWELPSETGKPTDFNYIFNRSWKSFSYKTTDQKELAVKGTNASGSFKGIPDIAPLSGDPKWDQKIREAFYTVYNFATGKTTDEERQKQAVKTIEGWKNSQEGKEYQNWLKTETGAQQFYSTYKTSKIPVTTLGIHSVSYTQNKTSLLNPFKRILTLEKYPERTQQYNRETEQN